VSTRSAIAERPLDWRALAQQFLFIAFVIGIPAGLATAPGVFRDGDVSWHVAAGRWMLENGRIPSTDPFSLTAGGHPWVPTEWLSELIYASAYNVAGYAGLAAVVACAMIALNAIVFFHLQRRGAAMPWASLLAMNVVLSPLILARPHVLAWPLLAGWTVLLLKYGEKGRPPPLWSALILVAWTNLHTSFPLAVPVAAAVAFDSLMLTRWKNLQQWLVFALVSFFATCANANGVPALVQPFHMSGMGLLVIIGEWNPTTTDNTPQFFLVLLAGLGLLLWRGVRVQAGRLLLLLLLLGMAFVHMRHQSAFIIIATCIVAPLFSRKIAIRPVPPLMLVGALPMLAVLAAMPLTPPESAANPRSLIAAIPAELKTQPVFNDYTMGGPLILAGIKPYIDGRAELYGDGFVFSYYRIENGDMKRFNAAVKRFDIRWTILRANSPLLKELDSSAGWRRIYADDVGVIHVRAPPDPVELAR
jgi:hypothetical protein